MFATHPKMAQRWAAHTPKGEKLPRKVHEKPLPPKSSYMMGEEPADDVNMSLPDPEETGQEFEKTTTVFAVWMPDLFRVRGETGQPGDYLIKDPDTDWLSSMGGEDFLKAYDLIPPKLNKVFQTR